MDFQHYHKYDEVIVFLNTWAKDFPNLVDLYSVGKSFEGRDIWQITITNKATGKDTDKPAMFVEGNRHSGEVTAGESALWMAWHVLSNYGKDPEITQARRYEGAIPQAQEQSRRLGHVSQHGPVQPEHGPALRR